jgi:hypothetical protein
MWHVSMKSKYLILWNSSVLVLYVLGTLIETPVGNNVFTFLV